MTEASKRLARVENNPTYRETLRIEIVISKVRFFDMQQHALNKVSEMFEIHIFLLKKKKKQKS